MPVLWEGGSVVRTRPQSVTCFFCVAWLPSRLLAELTAALCLPAEFKGRVKAVLLLLA